MTDCIVHTKRRVYCQQCIVLEEQCLLATLHIVVSFQLIVYAIIKYSTSLRVCCQAAKKNKQEGKNFA